MTEIPETPEEFDNEEEFKPYINRLHDQMELLEDEFTGSEKEKL